MVRIGPYLYKKHGDSVLQLLSPLEKERIRSTTCNPETSEPVLARKPLLWSHQSPAESTLAKYRNLSPNTEDGTLPFK